MLAEEPGAWRSTSGSINTSLWSPEQALCRFGSQLSNQTRVGVDLLKLCSYQICYLLP